MSAVTLSREGFEEETEAETSSGIVWSRREEGVVVAVRVELIVPRRPLLPLRVVRPPLLGRAEEEKFGLEKLDSGLVSSVEGKLRSAEPMRCGTELMSL